MARLQIKRGLKANLPTTGMLPGEPLVTTDRGTLHVALDETTRIPVVPAIDDLGTLGAVAPDEDFLLIHDGSASGQKEKKISFGSFKSALNIPSDATDEKAAVVAGGTSGYIWGTDGTDGIIRLNNSLSWAKDPGDAFVTIKVESVDGGTF